jgi:hypothetical protein
LLSSNSKEIQIGGRDLAKEGKHIGSLDGILTSSKMPMQNKKLGQG